jgi:hypothetical protein
MDDMTKEVLQDIVSGKILLSPNPYIDEKWMAEELLRLRSVSEKIAWEGDRRTGVPVLQERYDNIKQERERLEKENNFLKQQFKRVQTYLTGINFEFDCIKAELEEEE